MVDQAELVGRLDAVFKAYDIRGLVPDELNAATVERIGSAWARFIRQDDPDVSRVLVGRDMRPSGEELSLALASRLVMAGFEVVDLGLISTDQLYFASGTLDAPGAVFTASHNPAGYNGIKMCRSGAVPIGDDTGLAIIKALATELPPGDLPTRQGRTFSRDVLDDYVRHVRSFVDLSALRPLKVCVDTANGMGGLVVPAVFAGLGFAVDHLYPELDGTFPNHPADPIQPENIRDLQARVLETGADVGLAFDGDADRVFLVDELGRPLSGSTTTAMVAAAILKREPSATILHNLICSKAVPEIVHESGGTPIRTRVGHSYIKKEMATSGAAFGGEHSGHYYFRDNFRADSGMIAALVVLEMMSGAPEPLSELRRGFERYSSSGEINTSVADVSRVIAHVLAHFDGAQANIDRLDGLTVDMGHWWFNLRPSNTEPLLRLNLEAPTDLECETHVSEVLELIASYGE